MKRQNIDREWFFHYGDIPEIRYEQRVDTSKFRLIDLPHDWSIEFKPDPDSACGSDGGFFPTGMGWYVKSLYIPLEYRERKIFIEFEGVYMNSETWINGNYLGRHPYGYSGYFYDLTPYIVFDAENELRILADNSKQLNSRWYSGSGIYRHVWLITANRLHIGNWGTFITTREVLKERAEICVQVTVDNETCEDQKILIHSRIISPDGFISGVCESQAVIRIDGPVQYTHNVTIDSPLLWSPESPSMYQLESDITCNNIIIDTVVTPFGIRTLHFDVNEGFLLNGKKLKLKGGCVHHDNGVLGSASYDRAEERKIELMKASGFNAVRCAHNPPAPAFLEACDRLGMLVIDEAFDCWLEGKNNYDYHVNFEDWWCRDLDSMLLRDRNHPSIIMWSIGNELMERNGSSGGEKTVEALAGHVRGLDPTRPVTAAIVGSSRWPWEMTDAVFSALDVCGYNYQSEKYSTDSVRCPSRIIYGSESFPIKALEDWTRVMEMDRVIGDFVWAALDYLGEAGLGRVCLDGGTSVLGGYPWNQANCGDIDICGFKRPQSYYRDIVWQNGQKLHIVVHNPLNEGKNPVITQWGWPDVQSSWTWPGFENRILNVDVYSSYDEVELFLNEKLIGKESYSISEKYIASFIVPYEAGCLKAVGYSNGLKAAEDMLKTAQKPVRIRLTADRALLYAKYGDLSFVTVDIIDYGGTIYPCGDQEIFFTVKGEGSIEAVGSGNPTSCERYKGNQRMTYRGRCLVVVKSNGKPGEIRLRAQADNLDGAETVIVVE